MLLALDSTTRKLQAKMASTATTTNCSVTCTYADSATSTFTEGIYPSVLNGTTLVDILPAPAASTRRVVKSINVFNNDTVTHTVTIYLDDNSTSYAIKKITLVSGASWASDDVSVEVGIPDGDKGDITVSSGGTVWTIDAGTVSTSKLGGDITTAGKALLDDASASDQRTTLGLGSIATQNSSSISITGGSITGITDLAIADGGTGQSTRQAAMDALAGSATNGQYLRGDGASVVMAAIKVSDVPTLNQNTTGTASNVTGTVAIANGGTGATTASGALTSLGAYAASNPNGYTSNTGTVTSVGGTGTVNGITLTGSVTTSGNLTLGGTLSNVNLASQVTGTLPIANGGTGLTTTPANGQIDIGNGTGFARTTLTAGSNITITNGAGTITIASTSSGVTDTDKGDIVVSGGGTVWTIDSAVVSNAKLATMNANTIKARVAGSTGAPEDATLTQVLDLTGGSAQGSILYRGASTWTTLAPGTSGQFLRTNGFAGNPEWNTISATGTNTGDQNVFSVVAVAGQSDIVADTTSDTLTIVAGSNITITTNATSDTLTIASTGGGGGVTAVTGTSPVVSSGGTAPAISLASGYGDTQNPYASKTANFVLAAPNASAGVPTFRAIVASDIPTLNQNTTGTASNVTGTVAVANGGTGLTATPTNGQLDIGNGTGFARTTLTAGSNITITNGAGTITIASTAAGVTNGDKGDIVVSGSGDVWTIDSGVVSNAKLATMNASTIKARITGSTGAPEDATITQVLDLTGGSAQGSILYRGASTWTALAPGTSGQLLQTQGSGANPAWATISTSGLTVGTSAISGGSSGRVLYNNSGVLGELGTTGSGNVVLATGANVVNLVLSGTLSASGGTGTSGQVLQSTGSGVQWAAGGGGVPENHIYGLEMRWNPTNGGTTDNKRTVRISPGGAYIPSSGAVLTVSSSIDVVISTVTAKAWYYLYLYNNSGTPAIEASTTVPVFYYGRASQKTGDASRRFIGAVQADWNATPLLTPFTTMHQSDYVIYTHQGFDHRAQWRILTVPNNAATTPTNFNLRSTTASNLNAELVPDVVYKSYITAMVLTNGQPAGLGPRGLYSSASGTVPFDMSVYAQIPNVVFPFLPPATIPIDPSDGRTSYYVVATAGNPLYLDATGCEYWR